MTLKDFIRATAGMPSDTRLLVLDPWGGMEAAALVTIEDLVEGDPLRDDMPHDAIVLTGDAED
jgi:hypothetical protein